MSFKLNVSFGESERERVITKNFAIHDKNIVHGTLALVKTFSDIKDRDDRL